MLNRKKRKKRAGRSTMLRKRYMRAIANFRNPNLSGSERAEFGEAAIRAHNLWVRSIRLAQ